MTIVKASKSCECKKCGETINTGDYKHVQRKRKSICMDCGRKPLTRDEVFKEAWKNAEITEDRKAEIKKEVDLAIEDFVNGVELAGGYLTSDHEESLNSYNGYERKRTMTDKIIDKVFWWVE